MKNGVDIDNIAFATSTVATKNNGNWVAPIRLNLNSDKTKATITNVTIPAIGGDAPTGIYRIVAAISAGPIIAAGSIVPEMRVNGDDVALFASSTHYIVAAANTLNTRYYFVEFYVRSGNSIVRLTLANNGERNMSAQSTAGIHVYRVG